MNSIRRIVAIMINPAGNRQDLSHLRTKHAAILDRVFVIDTVAAVLHPVLTMHQKVEALLVTAEDEVNLPESLNQISRWKHRGNSPGERFVSLCEELFHSGPLHLVVIGINTPHIPMPFIQEAFGRLAHGAELVFGPTDSGGNYLIGLSHPLPAFFQKIRSQEGEETLNFTTFAGVETASLPSLYEIATDVDLNRLKIDLKRGVVTAPATAALLVTLPPTNDR